MSPAETLFVVAVEFGETSRVYKKTPVKLALSPGASNRNPWTYIRIVDEEGIFAGVSKFARRKGNFRYCAGEGQCGIHPSWVRKHDSRAGDGCSAPDQLNRWLDLVFIDLAPPFRPFQPPSPSVNLAHVHR